MAIGDALAVFLGTAITNYQPSSGVEVQVSTVAKAQVNDAFNLYNGSVVVQIFTTTLRTDNPQGASEATRQPGLNTAIMITNSIYLRKTGTSDTTYAGGVQTNA